jgi:AraC family transcriptional regulator
VTTLYIKNMVCPRCISTVAGILAQLGQPSARVALGQAQITGGLDLARLRPLLQAQGFELLQAPEAQLAEQVKNLLLAQVAQPARPVKLSVWLAQQLGVSYSRLSKTFAQQTGVSIEKYFIQLRIEKVKEWLSYGEQTLSEVAYALGYSSPQALSAQFKAVTGHTVTEFKARAAGSRRPLDGL